MKMPDKAQRQRIGSKATALLRGFLRVTEKVIRASISMVVPLVIAIYKTIQLLARADRGNNPKDILRKPDPIYYLGPDGDISYYPLTGYEEIHDRGGNYQ